jgi:valyl-tRNA synthetase
LVTIFEASLRLLSPFMPFITEEIWHALYQQKPPAKSIALTRFPSGAQDSGTQEDSIEEMQILQDLIAGIRNRRAELKIEPKQKAPVRIFARNGVRGLIESNHELIERMASVEGLEFSSESIAKLPGVQTTNAYEVAVLYERKIDVAAERDRLTKELKKLETEKANAERQLGNESFLAKAPSAVVEGLRRRYAELLDLIRKIRQALDELGNDG